MTVPTFAARKKAWSSPPVDDVGYVPSADLLAMDDQDFLYVIEEAVANRYEGWRNHRGAWTKYLTRWDTTAGQRILDYGCGIGLESLILAKKNQVILADISEGNLAVAERAIILNGHEHHGLHLISEHAPFIEPAPAELDIILCLGVLHHIPKPVPVVEAMGGWLKQGGELRLMLYSDEAWRIAVGKEPPVDPVEEDPGFEMFWKYWDPIGGYADWYDYYKLDRLFGEWFRVKSCKPLTEHGEYVAAVLVAR